jgi:hypothetical protein
MAEKALSESQRYKTEVGERVRNANKDLGDRLRTEGYEIDYSPDEDYLRVIFGVPDISETLSAIDGEMYVVFLIDPDSYLLNGVEVPNFMKTYRSSKRVKVFWSLTAELIESHGPRIYVAAEAETERAGRAVGDLILV